MSVISALQTFFNLRLYSADQRRQTSNLIAWYDKLRAYYLANGLYDSQVSMDYYLGTWDEAMKPLRDCAQRSVEFYVSKLEPGTIPDALPILAENQGIIEPLHQVWKWSNLAQQKPVVLRHFALYGGLFIKTVGEPDKVFFEFWEPRYVTDFAEDKRGNISTLRLEYGQTDRGLNKTRTEIWDEAGYRVYLHMFGPGQEERVLGTPIAMESLESMGIDFLPWSHAKFRDIGEDRGIGCFVHALDKIDEANRMATRLHQMLFRYNKPLWAASANALDPGGRPLPPPTFDGVGADGKLDIADDTILSLPGASRLDALVPNIQYGAALSILQDHMDEIEKDLPELAYAGLREKGELSGKAIRLLLGDAIDRALEARSNFEAALIKSDQHALTVGTRLGIFTGIGEYDSGDFEHEFQERDVIPLGEDEKAETLKVLKEAGLPLPMAAKLAGYSEEIQAELEKTEAENKRLAESIAAATPEREEGTPPSPAAGEEGEAAGSSV